MAGQADGSIIVDTDVDASGLEKGLDNLRSSMESLTAAIDRIGKKLESVVSNYAKSLAGGVRDVQRIQSGAEQAGESVKDALSEMTAKTEAVSAAADKTAQSYGKVAQEAEKAKAATAELYQETSQSAKRTATDVEESAKETEKTIGAEINGIATQLKTFSKDFETVQNGGMAANSFLLGGLIEGYENALNRLQALRSRLTSANEDEDLSYSEAEIAKLTQRLYEMAEQARASQEEIRNFARESRIALGENENDAPAISDLEAGIERAEAAFDKFQTKADKMDALGASEKQWASIQYDIEKAAEKVLEYAKKIQELKDSGAIDDETFKRLSDLLDALMKKGTHVADTVKANLPDAFNDVDSSADSAEQSLRGVDRELQQKGPDAEEAGRGVSALGRIFDGLSEKAKNSAKALAKTAWAAVVAGLRAIGAAAGEAAKNLTQMTATAVSGGIKRLGAWLSNAAKSMTLFGRSAKRNNGVLKKSFTTILKYGLGVRSFYYLFRKIRQAIKEGFENLSRYSDTLNASISGVISSFKRFENQFAASFAPLVNTIAPAISQLIDGLTEATFRAGQFIAALSGQKTVIRAKEVQEDFAASLEETKKAAKDAKNQLAGFDKLEILKEKDEHTDPNDMFETVPVEDEAKQFADDFKDAWINVDLSGIGKIVGGKIKAALDNIPWPDIQQGAKNAGKRLATFLNGLIAVPDLGKSLGKSIAEAVNAAFSFLDGFVWTFDWKGLGGAIMDTVEAACDNLNWELINHALQGLAIGLADLLNMIFSRVEVWEKVGRTIGKGINAAVSAGITFLERFDFKQAARAIVAGLNAAVDEIEWDKIGRFFGDLFGGALQFLYTAVTEFNWVKLGESLAESANECAAVLLEKIKDFDWAKIGTALADGLNAYISGIEWDKQGELFGKLIGGALTAAASFIRELDYGEIVQAIQDFFSNAIQQINWYDLLTVWGVAALIVALKKIIIAHPLLAILIGAVLALGPELGNAIDKMINDIPWAEVGQNISQFLINTLNRLNEAIESVDWQKLGTDLWNALVDVVTNIQWGELISKVFELLGAAVGATAGLIAGFAKGVWESLKSGFEATKEYFAAYIEEAGGNIVLGLLNGILNALANIGTWIYEHIFQPFMDGFWKAFEIGSPSKVMEEQGGFIVSGLFNGISAAWHFITDFFGDALDGLKETLGGAWETISGAASTAWNGISTTLSGIAGGIVSNIGGAWESIKTGASGKLAEVAKTVSGKWNGLKSDASKAWNELKASVGQTISAVKQDAVSRVSETVSGIKPQWAKMKTDAVSEWNGLKSSVVSSAVSVKSQVASAFQSLPGILSGVWSGIRSAASGALSSVSATVSSMVSSISSKVSSVRSTVSNITSSASDALSRVANKMDDLTRKAASTVTIGGLASGGVVTNSGHVRSWYDSVRKYASGTAKAAGSLFVAGEAGPELVGHVNGRTEVLNESQIASAIYSAVLSAMSEAVKTLGGFLSQQMATNTNALITAITQAQGPAPIELAPDSAALLERLSALSAAPYQVPAYATGTVMPYEVVAEIRRSADKITGCIDSNTEELIQTMITAFASQTATLASALTALRGAGGAQRQGASFNDLKDAANVWTQMYGQSPFFA